MAAGRLRNAALGDDVTQADIDAVLGESAAMADVFRDLIPMLGEVRRAAGGMLAPRLSKAAGAHLVGVLDTMQGQAQTLIDTVDRNRAHLAPLAAKVQAARRE